MHTIPYMVDGWIVKVCYRDMPYLQLSVLYLGDIFVILQWSSMYFGDTTLQVTTPKEELIAWQSRPMEIVARWRNFQLLSFLRKFIYLVIYFPTATHIFQVNLVWAWLEFPFKHKCSSWLDWVPLNINARPYKSKWLWPLKGRKLKPNNGMSTTTTILIL